jgi:hypothetical protein
MPFAGAPRRIGHFDQHLATISLPCGISEPRRDRLDPPP